MVKKKKSGKWFGALKILMMCIGGIFLTLCILAFTTLPFKAYYALGTKNSTITDTPTSIIMLSGDGIPSGDGLMRTFYTARLSVANPGIEVIIAMPGDTADAGSAARLAVEELKIRGVNPASISHELLGRNTREQAQKLAAGKSPAQLRNPIILVTAPEHMKRAVMTFRKCGFTAVSGFPAFECALEADLTFHDSDLKGNQIAPPIGRNLQVRYQFWKHLKYEVMVIREYLGLAYYKLKGWI